MIQSLAKKVYWVLSSQHLSLVCAESCTAGLVADSLASVPGISSVFWGSFVCYQNRAKQEMLGIDENRLKNYGPVSKEIAESMVIGALEHSTADIAVAITGIAGPDSDETGVPVGTVWISAARRGHIPLTTLHHLKGSRQRIRNQSAKKALELVLQLIGS